MLTAFKQYLTTLKLGSVSRKLYFSDVQKFLRWSTIPSVVEGSTLDKLSSPATYTKYLDSLRASATAPSMLKRTTASLRQFGTFLSVTYSVPNPVTIAPLSPLSSLLSPNQNYIKHFSNYLNAAHLSPLTIKSYKSDITRYLDWTSKELPGTDMIELLKDKNIKKYLNHLSVTGNTLSSTIERKDKSLTRFQVWYSTVYAPTHISDNIAVASDQPKEFRTLRQRVFGTSATVVAPDMALFTVKNFNYRNAFFLATLLLFTATLAVFGYRQFNRDVRLTAAYPSTPVTPNRQLSFQGRLENAGGTPITTATDFVFKLFTASSGGTELYSSGTCSIDPDSDGVFNTQIGDTCGAGITSSVFTENQDVWLEVKVGTETLDPRQQIATVAYSLNSETIQGFPISSTVSAIRNTVVPMNQWGEIIVGEQSPRLTGVSGTFAISAPTLTLSTTTGSNGNITLAPDGTGQVNLNGNTTSTNFFNVSNAQLTTGSLITGTAANNNTGFKLLDLLSGSSPTSKFSVTDAGLTTVGADLYVSSGVSLYNNAVSDDTFEGAKFCTGDGETNCVTDFSSFATGTNYWTRSAGNISPLTLNDTVSATTSAAVALTLTQTGAFNALLVEDQASDPTPFVIDQSGNVGIGTTGPDAKLDSLALTEQLRLTYTDGTVYSAHTVDSSGNLTIDNTGTKTIVADDLQITGGDILDSNGNESIRFGTTASAVNEATLTNAATAGTVLFAATGGDTDVALSIDSKGADALNLNGTATGDVNIAGGSGSTGCTVANATGILTCTVGVTAGALKWNGLTVPDGDLTLAMAANNTAFNWVPAADTAETNFTLSTQGRDTIGADEDQVLLALTQTDNTVDVTEAADALLTFANNDADDPVNAAIRFDAGAAGTDFAYGIDFDLSSIGTAELRLQNQETIDNVTDGTVNIGTTILKLTGGTSIVTDQTSFDLFNTTTTTLNVAGASTTLNLAAGGALTRAINIGTGTGADTISIGTGGTTADSITIGSTLASTSLALNDDNWNITGGGLANFVSIGAATPGTGTFTTLTSNADTTLGDAITDNITFTGRVAQDADLIPITATGTNDLGASSLPWDNIYVNNLTYGAAGSITLTDNTANAFQIKEGANVYVDITTTNDAESFSLNLPVGGATSHTANLFTANIAQTINLGTGTAADTINIGTGGTTADDINIGGFATSHLDITGVTNFAGGTTYFVDSSGNAKFLDLQVADTGNAGLTVGDGSTGFAKIGSLTIGDNNASVITFDANSDATPEFQLYNTGSATASGDVTMGGQLQVGRFAAAPTAVGEGAIIFNTTTDTHQCWNGSVWYNCGGTLYSNTNASVADGSYLTVTHALATNDLLSSAWIYAQGVWKSLTSSYQPAIAWEGKDTSRGNYHDQVNLYTPSEETNIYTENLLQSGLLFDTFEDSTKTDSANTTASTTQQMGDDGSANYMTLADRVQAGRTGLMGGQTYATSTTDNDGQTYLGSNTVNDIYYYDRTKDSTPEVLVELGIDPNWYNGVTLSVATSSASYSQNGTIADKNPNLTPSYNGSLIKATGTDSDPKTIYITIKTPTTFDWTNYTGDAATAVTITPGTAQTLGVTGVSVTFSAVNYNVGDVFKIASWFIEAEGTNRGAKQQFPERSNVVGTSSGIDIIDADTQKLWMGIDNTSWKSAATATTGVNMLNGILYASETNGSTNGSLRQINFINDLIRFYYTTGINESNVNNNIASRNSAGSALAVTNSTLTLVTNIAKDVSAAVIPNAPTQEVTVSGWGYIVGDATTIIEENVNLPYKFNATPNITTSYAAYTTTTAPTSLESCVNRADTASGIESFPGTITKNQFQLTIARSTGTFSASDYHCYTWTATGTVSPKQFVAVATGATSADGGTTIINETDGTKADILVGSLAGATLWSNKVAIANNTLYAAYSSTSPGTSLGVYYNLHGLQTPATFVGYRSGVYSTVQGGSSWYGTMASILGSAAAEEIKSLYVTENTSTISPGSSTIYLGTPSGVSVIQENRGGMNNSAGTERAGIESSGSVKYYTKDYISEEMIGDIRGMWPLNNANSSSDFEDVSVKANVAVGTNITAAGDSVSGVRGTATDFDGSTEYMTVASPDLPTGDYSYGAWVKPDTVTDEMIFIATDGGVSNEFYLYINSSAKVIVANDNTNIATSNQAIKAGEWTHIVTTRSGSTVSIYINGVLDITGTSSATLDFSTCDLGIGVDFDSGCTGTPGNYFDGAIDEAFVTATALTSGQIKNMYQVGYRALQSHGTTLGGGGADTNQQLGYISTGTSSVGVVAPDWNNQYMYVGTNSTTLGALSKIQLNSDTNIKTYNSSANVPTGGPLLIDEDITSLGVGYTLETVGSAASGVKSMGVDNNATATSGNFVSKTYALPKNIGSAVLWVSPTIDASDGSNTLTVKASNDAGSNYVTCTLVNTNSSPAVPEKEYACTFSTADNDLKVKFEFVRGSTKTNTYVAQYGISWLGETGFRVEQADTNNVRLYNFSGEAQNLKLNVTGASTAALANPWTDGGAYLYPTGYETLRIYDGAGSNYLSLSHSGTLAQLGYNGTAALNIDSSGKIGIGTTSPSSLLHLSSATDTEFRIASTGAGGRAYSLQTGTDSNLQLIDRTAGAARMTLDSSGNIGIGTTSFTGKLSIDADSANTATDAYGIYLTGSQTTANTGIYYGIGVAPDYTATSGNTLASLYGIHVYPKNANTGAVTNLVGARFAPENVSSGTVTNAYGLTAIPIKSGTGAITNAYGLYSRVDNTNASGAITNGYGLYIADSTETGTITNDYGLFQADTGAINYFGGNVGIGTSGPGQKLTVSANSTETSGTTYGAYFSGAQSVANAGSFVGLGLGPSYTAASGNTLGSLHGVRSIPSNNSTGTITSLYGGSFEPNNISSGVVTNMFGLISIPTKSGTGAVTDTYGLYSRVDNTNASGAITNGYGLYIADSTETGTITNDYGLYQVDTGAKNYFGGNLGIGVSPSYPLDVGAIAAGQNAIRIDSQSTGSDYSAILMARGGTTRFNIYIEPSSNNLFFLDANDNQANIRNDASAQNDDGWVTAAVDYGEFMKKQNPSDDIKPFEIVGIKNGLVTKDTNNSTLYMVTSSDSGIRGGNPLDDARDDNSEWIVVAYTGQVPVLVNSDAQIGDYVIPSGLNDGKGLAVSSSEITPDQYKTVIGVILNEFDASVLGGGDGGFESDVQELIARKGTSKVANVAVGVGIKAQIALNESGDVILSGDAQDSYQVATSEGIVTKIGAFAKATIAKLTAGIGSFGQVETNLISPLAEGQTIEIKGPVVIKPLQGSVPCTDNQQGTEPCNSPELQVDGEISSDTISARVAKLHDIQAENITAKNIVADTISAGHIEGLDAKIATLSAELTDAEVETITGRIKSRLALLTGNEPSAEDVPIPAPETTDDPSIYNLESNISTTSATLASADIDFATINDYLAVIGTATITELEVTGHLYATQIESKTGLLALGEGTLLIDSSGHVAINGDLTVSGKIIADSASLGSLSLGSELPNSSEPSALGQLLSVYDESGTAVATIDASGSANLASLTTNMITIASPAMATQSGLATLLGTAQSNATAGQNILVSPGTELTIESPYVTPNSLVYLTPTGNTDNKVLFVKSKKSCDSLESNSSLLASCIPSFTVGIDAPASSDISFNWWIIQLSPPSQ